MKQVTLTKGLPGCGKDYWAKKLMADFPGRYKRVNKDDIRLLLDDSKWSDTNEKFVLKVRDQLILMSLEAGYHVLVTDTNLAPKHEEHIRQLVKGLAEVNINDFTAVPLKTCIERDKQRLATVGESVIIDMHDKYLKKVEIYSEDPSLPRAIIVDIDGTLAKMKGRSPFDWERVKQDAVNDPVKKIVNSYSGQVIVFSGRDGICMRQTFDWLNENEINFDQLHMRQIGNTEKDSIIKRAMFEKNVRGKFFIEFVLDDRNQVVDMWRDMGLTCLQVAPGNF